MPVTAKGQVTVFILLGVVLVLLVGVGSYLIFSGGDVVSVTRSAESTVLDGTIQSCLAETLTEGVFLVASQGDILYRDSKTLALEAQDVRYHILKGTNIGMSNTEVERAIAEYIVKTLPECVRAPAAVFGVDVNATVPIARVKLTKSTVDATVEFPLVVKQGESKKTAGDQVATIAVPLSEMMSEGKKIVQKMLSGGEDIDVSFLSSLQFKVDVLPYAEDTLIYSLSAPETSDKYGGVLRYSFATQIQKKERVRLAFIPDVTVDVGQVFSYAVILAEGDNVKFELAKGAGSINATSGVFTFQSSVQGNFTQNVCAVGKEAKDCKAFVVFVE